MLLLNYNNNIKFNTQAIFSKKLNTDNLHQIINTNYIIFINRNNMSIFNNIFQYNCTNITVI